MHPLPVLFYLDFQNTFPGRTLHYALLRRPEIALGRFAECKICQAKRCICAQAAVSSLSRGRDNEIDIRRYSLACLVCPAALA